MRSRADPRAATSLTRAKTSTSGQVPLLDLDIERAGSRSANVRFCHRHHSSDPYVSTLRPEIATSLRAPGAQHRTAEIPAPSSGTTLTRHQTLPAIPSVGP